MPVRPLTGVLRCLRRAVLAAEANGASDGELLERYRSSHDESAFETLLRRHAAMVWGVCCRNLGNIHDAEDAFQATFLVLVRKAGSIRPAHMVGNWLHGVAYRTAMNARANRSRRRQRESDAGRLEKPCAETDRALVTLLDVEVERLPEKYRAVLVLCDLEGRTRKEAARQLRCPEGTIAGRLVRARALLAKRLRRHGLPLCGGTLALELARTTASAAVPQPLIAVAVKTSALFALGTAAGGIPANIVALSKGVLKAMLLDKLKLIALVVTMVLVGLASTTVGVAPFRTVAAAEPQEEASPPQPQAQPAQPGTSSYAPPPLHADRDPAIQGVWSLERTVRDGRTLPLKPGSVAIVITNRYLIWKEDNEDRAMAYKVKPDRAPKHIDLVSLEPGQDKGARILGIYDVAGDTLVIHESDGLRPRYLKSAGMGTTVFIYRRVAGFGAGQPMPKTSLTPDSADTWGNKLFEAKGSTTHDFGKLARGKQATHRIHLKNIYSVPLDITEIRVSCGCVTVTAALKRLLPGEETHIDVNLDTRRFSGPKAITLYVGVQGSGYVSTARLQVTAESVEETGDLPGRQQKLDAKIVRVDSQNKLVEVNIGTDQGMKKNQRLRIFRLQPRAEYLGEARVVQLEATRMVCRIAPPLFSAPLQAGDAIGILFGTADTDSP